MPVEITMPKLSDTMTDGTLVKWLKQEGDAIKPGDIIAEVETDKATQELEAFETGTVARIVIPAGGKTPVGGVIVVIAKPGEDVKAVAANVKAVATPVATAPVAAGAPAPAVAVSASGAPIVARESAPQSGAAPVVDHDEGTEQRSMGGGKQRVSPLARKIADEKGIALASIRGTGPDGRIIKRDVLLAASQPQRVGPGSGTPAAPAPGVAAPPVAPRVVKFEEKTIPLSSMRQTIARRLVASKQQIPHFYVSVEVLVDALLALRSSANEQLAPEKLSVTDFITRAVAVALTRVPGVNASFTDAAIVQHGSVDLGIAVAVEDGLVVPVLRAAHAKSVRQISQEIKTLAELARTRRLKAQDMSGATFTISNLGMYGVKDFAAIINPPESAILAVGGTHWQPVVNAQRQIVPAQVMSLTLSADHRVVDGATGAQFLAELKKILENPLTMLI
jgi:pyruvate dehydrogenase E2 component (dihydrolipoamide acetyltransferase)